MATGIANEYILSDSEFELISNSLKRILVDVYVVDNKGGEDKGGRSIKGASIRIESQKRRSAGKRRYNLYAMFEQVKHKHVSFEGCRSGVKLAFKKYDKAA